jgi:hypothetical protein
VAAGPSPYAWTTKATAGKGPVGQFIAPTPNERDASFVTSRPTVANIASPLAFPRVLTSGSQLDHTAQPTQQPITPGFPSRAGSQFNRAIDGAPWPWLLPDGESNFRNGTKPFGRLVQVAHHNTPGNYGLMTSVANFAYRFRVFAPGANLRVVKTGKGSVIAGQKSVISLPLTAVESGGAEVAGYPGIVQNAPGKRVYNNLLAVVFGLRVNNPVRGGSLDNTIQPNFVVGVFNRPMQFTAAGNASLSMKGEVLQ